MMVMVMIAGVSVAYAQIASTQQQQLVPLLPPVQTTFPPSVFPPTQSFLPPTSFAIPTGSLSPWFPSLPAITCSGMFTFTIVGDASSSSGSSGSNSKNSKDDGNNDSSDKDKHTIAIQVIAAGGTSLDKNSISGKIYKGKSNIESNKGNNFKVDNLANDCQTTSFDKSGNSATASNSVAGSNGGILGSAITGGQVPTTTGTFGFPSATAGSYPYSFPATPGVACPPGYNRSPDGSLCVLY
jgi:hypothetical protein